ncbi:btaf1 RNA polymerase II, B-TFIID transcription factor-associated, 170kDa [Chamberlinius hualienensis]
MSSRLDRLFILLDTGSSAVTRRAAALQLGEVQKLHPHELYNLLNKVHQYLRSNSWETRIAAGQAVEAIVRNVPQWDPIPSIIKKEEGECSVSLSGRMNFTNFDVNKVLRHGDCLLGSEGKEYELNENLQGVELRENLARQRTLLNQRLGLEAAEKMGLDLGDIVTNEDIAPHYQHSTHVISNKANLQRNKKAISEMVIAELSQLGSGLSSREMNRAKRKARLIAKQKSKEAQQEVAGSVPTNGIDIDEPEFKKVKTMDDQRHQEDASAAESINESSQLYEESGEWPFESLCDQLCHDLFTPAWETRHGAATALREVIRIHGSGAGKTVDQTKVQMEIANRLWLEDVALRLLCVLALDRFGDFISDQVVAPVRETCAQGLGTILNLMDEEGVFGILSVLLQLLRQNEWEARHGGLLGIKYLLAVRRDLTSLLLPRVFPTVFQGLKDKVDDVSAVAAAALVPICDFLVKVLPLEIPNVVALLWDSLLELDDLTSSTNSIMALLESLLGFPELKDDSANTSLPLDQLVPRLWPFLSHNSTSVRKATLRTLGALVSTQRSQSWLVPILPETLRHLFQRCILEHSEEILELIPVVWSSVLSSSPLEALLTSACPFIGSWLCLAMQPSKFPIDRNFLLEAKHKIKIGVRNKNSDFSSAKEEECYYIGGFECVGDDQQEREKWVIRARCMAARLLGLLSRYVCQTLPNVVYPPGIESPVDCYARLVNFHLNSKSGIQRFTICVVLIEWAKSDKECLCPSSVKNLLLNGLSETICYDEIALSFTRMQQECNDFLSLCQHYKLKVSTIHSPGTILTIDQAINILTTGFQTICLGTRLRPKVLETLEEKRKSVLGSVKLLSSEQSSLHITVMASMAAAIVAFKHVLEKLNPVIKPLMDAIKKEENKQLQKLAGKSLTQLLEMCIGRASCPNGKIIRNLCVLLTSDLNFTPSVKLNINGNDVGTSEACDSGSSNRSEVDGVTVSTKLGILTLHKQQKNAEKANIRRSNSVNKSKSATLNMEFAIDDINLGATEDEIQRLNELQRRGAQFAISEIAVHFGDQLPEKVSVLWELIWEPLRKINPDEYCSNDLSNDDDAAQELVSSLQVLEVIGPFLDINLHNHLTAKLLHVCCCLDHPYTAVRHMAARCLGTLSKIVTRSTMEVVVEKLLPCLEDLDNTTKRQGVIEALACIIEKLGFALVPYIVLLIVPVMGRMSDHNISVRHMATSCFATLIRLLPLGGSKDEEFLSSSLAERNQKEKRFLEQLFDIKKVESYKIPLEIRAELRSYQQSGVDWLAFLNRYKLHGILCDDMGLGKTLQSICILASDHYYRDQEYKKSKSLDCAPLPSLVVCPPTLTGHWMYEVEKFVSKECLHPLNYAGPPNERQKLRSKVKKRNLIIASYDIVRNDIDFFSSIKWNYCILDEGHIIKNGKTKLSKAIKHLIANHRLILSGTPIQNNVLELWSLFDFLMPGFLGTEKQFTTRYSRPILCSRDAKSSSKEQEAGALAMESLHRQVLPFLLRRMKEDVLQDLPPKIIQDYYCDLSPLQAQLYEDFAKTRAKRSLDESLSKDEKASHGTAHIFQALQYLRKVCNHPKLVLSAQHPEFEHIQSKIKQQNSSLCDIQHAAKLQALKQLLLDCGIGVENMSQDIVVNQHRALVFCQLKSMLDILEQDLFQSHMPKVTYLRLDGSIPASQRHSVVHRFNNDPSIDVLLLTTQVGGLGINLTGADTVIFVEHDWNPMKDLQAMDRAHRIGQKKVVNVYRLITKGTLEEKIMGLQKFKLTIANTVISQENSSLQSMGTDQLLDLFILDDTKKDSKAGSSGKSDSQDPKSKGIKSVLENLPELWDDKQYETEYDLHNFLHLLQNA